jgi:hypothetical protein
MTDGSCTFDTGKITVRNTRGATIFADDLDNGTISKKGNTALIIADLLPDSMFPTGGIEQMSIRYTPGPPFTTELMSGRSSASEVPEPGTLGMLGTGLIGLAGLARRKLKLWT